MCLSTVYDSNLYLILYIEAPTLSIRTLIHVLFPALRVLLLAPLLMGLVAPRIVYSSVQTYDDIESPTLDPIPTASTFLLPPQSDAQSSTGLTSVPGHNIENSKYGTFRPIRSTLQASAPTTRAATPAPSTAPDNKVWIDTVKILRCLAYC